MGLDPGTWNVGWAVWNVDERTSESGDIKAEATPEARDGKRGYHFRMQDLGNKVLTLLEEKKPTVVVVEEPSSFGRGHRGQSRLSLTVGFLAGVILGFGTSVRLVRVEEWYPCSPGTRRRAKKDVALAILANRFGVENEHALMARGLVHWFVHGERL